MLWQDSQRWTKHKLLLWKQRSQKKSRSFKALLEQVPFSFLFPSFLLGKTFVGIQIIRALLTFNPRIIQYEMDRQNGANHLGPILCVCYTNHALDQFLVGLLNAGIESIIRVGGKKCERLESFNLKNQSKPNLGRRGFQIKKELLPAMDKRIEALNSFLNNKNKFVLWTLFYRILCFRTPHWYQMQNLISTTCPWFMQSLENRVSSDPRIENIDEAWNHWCRLGSNSVAARSGQNRSLDRLLELDDFWDISGFFFALSCH